MNTLARNTLWGAVIFAVIETVPVLGIVSVRWDTESITVSDMLRDVAQAAIAASLLGAAVGGLLTCFGRLIAWAYKPEKRPMPVIQYDAPQEGVWPPPPLVSDGHIQETRK